jgi:hypothetical protein
MFQEIWTYEIFYKILLWNLLSFQVYCRDLLKKILKILVYIFLIFLRISINFRSLIAFLEYLTNKRIWKKKIDEQWWPKPANGLKPNPHPPPTQNY